MGARDRQAREDGATLEGEGRLGAREDGADEVKEA